jgi:hypothetical protein
MQESRSWLHGGPPGDDPSDRVVDRNKRVRSRQRPERHRTRQMAPMTILYDTELGAALRGCAGKCAKARCDLGSTGLLQAHAGTGQVPQVGD